MTQTAERIEFQAETKELLSLVVHSLYTHKEIFLRELISNASDALDKLRVEALTHPELCEDPSKLGIQLAVDTEARLLCVIDNGIGMSREEVTQNLGTIARSGTKSFVQALAKNKSGAEKPELPELIGQFGVGFYASFMVADEVVFETRRAGEEKGTRWISRGDGDFTVEEIDKPNVGSTVILHLKKTEDGDDDFASEYRLRDLVKRYSDFIEYPIEMEMGVDDERKSMVLNSQKPIWTRTRSDVTEEEHQEFYRHLSHDWQAPLEVVHFKAEGASEYTALLYIPGQRPMDFFQPNQAKSRIQLYVKRVFVTADCEELAPVWLRFVCGVVDSSDLPLNVSRETLQHNRQLGQIQKRVTRKVLDSLKALLEKRRDDYLKFWQAFGPVLKEGLYYEEDEHRETVAELTMFASTAGEELATLGEYVERMPVKQKAIYVLVGNDLQKARKSPHLEAFERDGFEVLFLTDPVDEFVLQRFKEFQGKDLVQIDKGDVDLEDEADAEERKEKEKELEPMLEATRKELHERVEDVRFSSRLTDSPACLVGGENALSAHMERFMRDSGQIVPESKRTLELNANHPLIAKLRGLSEDPAMNERFGKYCELIFGQALLAEGSSPPDPAQFSALVTELMLE